MTLYVKALNDIDFSLRMFYWDDRKRRDLQIWINNAHYFVDVSIVHPDAAASYAARAPRERLATAVATASRRTAKYRPNPACFLLVVESFGGLDVKACRVYFCFEVCSHCVFTECRERWLWLCNAETV